MKQTWASVDDLINYGKKKSRRFSSVRSPTRGNLRWLKTVSSIFQDVDFDGS